MDLKDQTLEDWLRESKSSFNISGAETLFYSLYDSLKTALIPIHTDVTQGAILSELETKIDEAKAEVTEHIENEKDPTEIEGKLFQYEKIKWLNDHGINHIKCVIKRASHLIQNAVDLKPREVFCLLCAIQLHDIGNLFGRLGHESKIRDVIADNANKIGSDHIERQYIAQIAQVHGGKVVSTGSKDTISTLKQTAPVMDEQIRLRLLASIVRFADELGDERNRANVTLLKEGKIPKSSEVYHAYSFVISSVIIDHLKKTVEIHFDIPKEFLQRKFGKDSGETYLIDEIYERTLKMYREKIYCSRFWKPYIDIENILVIINFFDEGFFGQVLPEISYTLRENGYPTEPNDIFLMCSESLHKDGNRMDGDFFKSLLN